MRFSDDVKIYWVIGLLWNGSSDEIALFIVFAVYPEDVYIVFYLINVT